MNYAAGQQTNNIIAALHRLAQSRVPEERCEFCSASIAPRHRHLLEIPQRKLICVCEPCAFRFQGVVGGRYKLIPRTARWLSDFHLTQQQWDNLALPINLTFFYHDSAAAKVIAMYPSPAGATESLLPAKNWDELASQNQVLGGIESDVEALLVNRVGLNREYYIVPMDVCYELVGHIRTHWRGLSGGEKVWEAIDNFFAQLREHAEVTDAKQAEVLRA
jgi:hypothetical protein